VTGFDYRALNMRREDGTWLCASCGFPDYFTGKSFDENGPLIGSGICPCCMYEPGFDDIAGASAVGFDSPLLALQAYSKEWRQHGMVWRGMGDWMPHGWNPETQMADWILHAPKELIG
jgi:hypothetical protein